MRILLEMKPEKEYVYSEINKHHIQSFIYKIIKDSPFDVLHNLRGFKFFTFSDISPPTDYKTNELKYMVISSPSAPFIKFIKYKLKELSFVKFRDLKLEVNVKRIPNKLPKEWITASPIVVKKGKNEYFSFIKDTNITFFLERLKQLAIEKYNAYYNDEFWFEEPLFDVMKFSKSVAVNITKQDKKFIIIGSMWRLLKKEYIPRDLKKFYRFTFDVGLGEKNSLGFGCINERR